MKHAILPKSMRTHRAWTRTSKTWRSHPSLTRKDMKLWESSTTINIRPIPMQTGVETQDYQARNKLWTRLNSKEEMADICSSTWTIPMFISSVLMMHTKEVLVRHIRSSSKLAMHHSCVKKMSCKDSPMERAGAIWIVRISTWEMLADIITKTRSKISIAEWNTITTATKINSTTYNITTEWMQAQVPTELVCHHIRNNMHVCWWIYSKPWTWWHRSSIIIITNASRRYFYKRIKIFSAWNNSISFNGLEAASSPSSKMMKMRWVQ